MPDASSWLSGFQPSNELSVPFSSLTDPVDLARAQGALEAAWRVLEHAVPEDDRERARTRLAYMVASYLHVAVDEADLAYRAVERFKRPT